MIQKDILRRLLTGFYFLQSSVLLLWLTHYSYRAKELLVCWLLFSSFFAVLVLVLLGVVLAGYAGHHLVKWVSVAEAVIPELLVSLAQIPQEVGATPPDSSSQGISRPWLAPTLPSMHSPPILLS